MSAIDVEPVTVAKSANTQSLSVSTANATGIEPLGGNGSNLGSELSSDVLYQCVR